MDAHRHDLGLHGGLPGSHARLRSENPWFTRLDVDRISRITPPGLISEFGLPTRRFTLHGLRAGRGRRMCPR